MPPGAIVARSAAFGARLFAHRLKFLGGRVAAIGLALCEQLLGDFAVTLGARKLVNRLAIPIELEPAQAIEDGEDRALGRAGLVGVLDAQQHVPAWVLGVQPSERGGRRTADMEIARRRRRKARDDLFAHSSSISRQLTCPRFN